MMNNSNKKKRVSAREEVLGEEEEQRNNKIKKENEAKVSCSLCRNGGFRTRAQVARESCKLM
jgi:hypothetical protein